MVGHKPGDFGMKKRSMTVEEAEVRMRELAEEERRRWPLLTEAEKAEELADVEAYLKAKAAIEKDPTILLRGYDEDEYDD